MAVITINGQVGSGASEIGAIVAERLSYDYVDRFILAEAANRLGSSVGELIAREQQPPTRRERFTRFLDNVVARAAVDSSIDPFMGTTLGMDYESFMEAHIATPDQSFLEVTVGIIREVAAEGNVVIISRASNHILKEHQGALHVGLVSTLESKTRLMAKRQNVSEEEARPIVRAQERARNDYFARYFSATVDNPRDYHLMVNTDLMGHEGSADIIVGALGAVR